MNLAPFFGAWPILANWSQSDQQKIHSFVLSGYTKKRVRIVLVKLRYRQHTHTHTHTHTHSGRLRGVRLKLKTFLVEVIL